MKVKHFPILLLLGAAFLGTIFSCKDKEEPIGTGKYERGIFVVNEGPFGGTGTITYHNPDTKETVQDIFGLENKGAALGQFVQSLTFHKGKGYICATDANKIYVVDANTFVAEGAIEGLSKPRYFLAIDDETAVVSQWGSDGVSGELLKIDLASNKITGRVSVGSGPEKPFLFNGNSVVVPNVGGWGIDSTIVAVDWKTMSILTTQVAGGKNPAALANGNFPPGNPYVLCLGVFGDSLSGWVGGVNSPTANGFSFSNTFTNDLVSDAANEHLYFSAGGKIFDFSSAGLKTLTDIAAYGLAFDGKNNLLYAGEAKANEAGQVLVLNPANGQVISLFAAGINPGEIVIRND